jgi:RNA polymerase sigma-70 factor (ECF subfamily)
VNPPSEPADGAEFTRLLLLNQRRIAGLIFALVPRGADADDVMQETCAVMWRKFGEFRAGTDFGAWALRIARFQVMGFYNRRRRAQARLSDETIEALAETMSEPRWESSARAEALRACVGQLKERDFELVRRRYTAGETVAEIAASLGGTADTIYKAISRLHLRLLTCVNSKLRTAQP